MEQMEYVLQYVTVHPTGLQDEEARHGKVIYLVLSQECLTGVWKQRNSQQFI